MDEEKKIRNYWNGQRTFVFVVFECQFSLWSHGLFTPSILKRKVQFHQIVSRLLFILSKRKKKRTTIVLFYYRTWRKIVFFSFLFHVSRCVANDVFHFSCFVRYKTKKNYQQQHNQAAARWTWNDLPEQVK